VSTVISVVASYTAPGYILLKLRLSPAFGTKYPLKSVDGQTSHATPLRISGGDKGITNDSMEFLPLCQPIIDTSVVYPDQSHHA
jgi:hypothetical protein